MSTLDINGSPLGNALQVLLLADDITPGDSPSYQTCKTIMAYHPLGAKMTDKPITMAQSQPRKIAVPKGPEDRLVEAFNAEWLSLGANNHIFNTARLARCYGVSTLALLAEGVPTDRPLKYDRLPDLTIGFNVFDPLNTAGSLVNSQLPNNISFQKVAGGVTVQGQAYHPSRCVVVLNENPLYIEYTSSAFGYVGRSVFQRSLYPLKSYIQTMVTNDMVSKKAGLLVAFMKGAGSIVDNIQAAVAGVKRAMVKMGVTGNVMSMEVGEDIKSIDLGNIDAPFQSARRNILLDIAAGADMPAVLLNQETFAEGFGEGTEDAKLVASYVTTIREWLEPLYTFMDQVVIYRAWTPEFYKTIQRDFPEEYGSVPYLKAFNDWRNSYSATWPNLLEEPDSEKVKVDDVKLKAVVAMLEVLMPAVDPENKATLVQWACDNFNELKRMFSHELVLDYDALAEYEPPVPMAADAEPSEPKPFAASDSADRRRVAMEGLARAVGALPDLQAQRRARTERVRA